MKDVFIKQAAFVPLTALLIPMLLGFTLPGYSSLSQHMSELELLDSPVALITRAASVVNGVSIILFAVGVSLLKRQQFWFTTITATLAGVAMISNGVFPMGHPLHGLYALSLFSVLVPACFVAELGGARRIANLCLLASLLTLVYFWLQLSGFDPHGFRGLTQRIAIVIMFGWYAVAVNALQTENRLGQATSRSSSLDTSAKG